MQTSIQFTKLIEKIDPSKNYIIAIQGCSASGKTTMSNHITQELIKNRIPTVLISLDNYYKTLNGSEEELLSYDFDNPAALDWDAIKETVESYKLNGDTVIEYRRSFQTKICQKIEIPNIHPRIIIFEGIFGFNIFNEKIFNIDQFDPYNSKKTIEEEYKINTMCYKNYNLIKIQLNIEREKVKEVRLQRDLENNVYSREMSIARFEDKIWPSTLRWVYSSMNSTDVVIEGGTFNIDDTELVIQSIMKIFDLPCDPCSFRKGLSAIFKMKKRSIKA